MKSIGRAKDMLALMDHLAVSGECRNRNLVRNTGASLSADWRESVVAEEQKGEPQH